MTFLRELLSRRRINRLTEIQRRLDELPELITGHLALSAALWRENYAEASWLFAKLAKRRQAEQSRLIKEQHKLRRKMV
jgi:hypothetical protein